MFKTIKIPFELPEQKEALSISVKYSIEDKSNDVSFIHCKVDMAVEEIPEWLFPYEFVIKKYYNAGITVRSILADKYKTVEAALFTNAAADHIRVKETYEHRFI